MNIIIYICLGLSLLLFDYYFFKCNPLYIWYWKKIKEYRQKF